MTMGDYTEESSPAVKEKPVFDFSKEYGIFKNPPKSFTKTISDEVSDIEEAKLICVKLHKILLKENNGIAVAAPQTGIFKRIILIKVVRTEYPELEEKDYFKVYKSVFGTDCAYLCAINPTIVNSSGKIKFKEGCLSFPNKIIEKKRKQLITVNFKTFDGLDKTIAVVGQRAVVWQHEIDHLNGITFLD
jgi:peptide deformylase